MSGEAITNDRNPYLLWGSTIEMREPTLRAIRKITAAAKVWAVLF